MGGDDTRSEDRTRKTLSLPTELVNVIQEIADKKYGGDFTRAVMEDLAPKYPEVAEFLRTNTNYKYTPKRKRK